MKEAVVWLIHLPAGSIAIAAAIAALCYSKGSQKHRRAGIVFMIAMIIMLFSGGIAGVLKGSPEDVFLAALVFYSVSTAWLAARSHHPSTRNLEYISLIYIVFFGFSALSIDPEWDRLKEPGLLKFFAAMALIFATGDIRNVLRRGITQTQRLARHIWRTSFSMAWMALAFGDKVIKMLGSDADQVPYVFLLPAGLILSIMVFWLFKIYRGGKFSAP